VGSRLDPFGIRVSGVADGGVQAATLALHDPVL